MKQINDPMLDLQADAEARSNIEDGSRRRFITGLGAGALLLGLGIGESKAGSLPAFSSGPAGSPLSTNRFTHPGLLVNEDDFTRIRNKIRSGEQPWTNWWKTLCSASATDLHGKPNPQVAVYRYTNAGAMHWDIQRAYCCALRWKISGDEAYAKLAVDTLDAWSAALKAIGTIPPGSTMHEDWTGFLLAGIQGHQWANAAEIMRTYPGWTRQGVARFQSMLRTVFASMASGWLQGVATRNNGEPWAAFANWDLAALAGTLAIGVFCDDLDLYKQAIDYYTSNNRGDIGKVFGNGASIHTVYFMHPGFMGQWQESGRDQGHATLGMSMCGVLCEMAWKQGDDLYSLFNNRFLAGAEYVAKSNLLDQHGKPYVLPFAPQWSSQGTFTADNNQSYQNMRACWETIYNHYVNRMGLDAPNVSKMVLKSEPNYWSGNGDDMVFPTLTNRLDNYVGQLRAPFGVSAVCTGGKVVLSWWGGKGTASYLVKRSNSANGPFAVIGSVASGEVRTFSDTPSHGVWFYQIQASNSASAASHPIRVAFPGELRCSINLADGGGNSAVGWVTPSNGEWIPSNGTLMSGASWGTGRTSGSAVAFDGKESYVELPASLLTDLGDFTVAMWAYANSLHWDSCLLFIGQDGGAYMRLAPQSGSGHVRFAICAASYHDEQAVEASVPLAVGRWTHIAVTLSGNTGKIYLDGKLAGVTDSILLSPHQLGDQIRMLGRDTNHPAFNGRIQDFCLYSMALSDAEIAALAK
ncbi:LamG-like jellyroll fold domain-containing protein [Dyella humi]|uniref:Alginate lyase family protein n=1 Tax=Dyella humi TaxID=1770547 RepID=A0ABW8IFK3_9GAMM